MQHAVTRQALRDEEDSGRLDTSETLTADEASFQQWRRDCVGLPWSATQGTEPTPHERRNPAPSHAVACPLQRRSVRAARNITVRSTTMTSCSNCEITVRSSFSQVVYHTCPSGRGQRHQRSSLAEVSGRKPQEAFVM